MSEYEHEPIPGLPGLLPPGETILWQGKPDWRVLARTAFHTGAVGGYFALLTGIALLSGAPLVGVAATALSGMLAVALLNLLAWATARGAIYTLTNRRIVLRIGVALPKCINVPLGQITSLDMRRRARGTGDLVVTPAGSARIGYAALWPHAQAWHYAAPRPMLRALPAIDEIAALAARQVRLAQGTGIVTAPEPRATPMPAPAGQAVPA